MHAVSICPEDGKVDKFCFSEAQEFVYKTLQERFIYSYNIAIIYFCFILQVCPRDGWQQCYSIAVINIAMARLKL